MKYQFDCCLTPVCTKALIEDTYVTADNPDFHAAVTLVTSSMCEMSTT